MTTNSLMLARDGTARRIASFRSSPSSGAGRCRLDRTMAEVLVCEDDEDIALLVRLALQGAGHGVTSTRDVAGALAAVAERHYDVVVTDLGLPDGDGVVVCGAASVAGSRVVVITASPQRLEEPELAGAAGVRKPFDPAALVDAVGG